MEASSGWAGRAFGVSIEASHPIPGIIADTERLPRRVRWSEATPSELDEGWQPRQQESLVDMRHPDGRLFMSVAYDPDFGYRTEAPGYGVHVVDPHGAAIASSLPRDGTRLWQRLFFAQVLPLAAAASGIDVFHAGAVAVDGRAFAFVASSGTGKTSVVANLVATGADFLTDDVLALEPSGQTVIAHAGAAALSINAAQLGALEPAEHERVARATWAESDGKLHVDVAGAPRLAAPLGGLFFLHRTTSTVLTIRREVKAMGPMLLGAAFLPYVKSPRRIATHLDVTAAVARAAPTYFVAIPATGDARATAARILEFGTDEGLWSA